MISARSLQTTAASVPQRRGIHHRVATFATGLLKAGLPSVKDLSAHDPAIAELLEPQGKVIAQFGKNHIGDGNEFLPGVDQGRASTKARRRPRPGVDQGQASTKARRRPRPGVDQGKCGGDVAACEERYDALR